MQSANIHQQEITNHINNDWVISYNTKPAVAWLVFTGIIAAAAACLFIIITENSMQAVYKYGFIAFFLLAGMPNVFIFPKWFPQLHSSNRFLYILLLSAVVSVIVFTVFSMSAVNTALLSVAAGAAFMLPYMLQLCWYYFSGMQAVNKAWYMPKDMQPETRMSLLLLNSMPFAIKIKAKEQDDKALLYPVALNGKLNLSAMFCRFLYNQQDTVQAVKENDEQYAWLFFTERWYGLQALDPAKSLIKNGVKENDIIIIERA
jgi:hypothetical protein